jgi:predicted DCC family thiol-disulfide oxidoreductase YuxK
MITVYFDGNCQVCSTGILYYKKILKHQLIIKDFNDPASGVPEAIKDEVSKKMYVSVQGHFMGGIDAFQVIWQTMPSNYWGSKILLGLSYVPGIRTLMDLGYYLFSRVRHVFNKR